MGRMKQLVIFVATLYLAMWWLDDHSRYSPEFLKGKTVLVTGASSGVGEQLAYHYSKMGSRLLLAARRSEFLKKVAEKCQKLGAKSVNVLPGDLTLEETRVKLGKMVDKVFEGELDQLLLSHGVYEARRWTGSEQDIGYLKSSMSTNLVSFVDLAAKLMPKLVKREGGIGVVSGLNGIIPAPLLADLSASHAAQQRFFSSLRQELMDSENSNVTVTTVILGLIKTEKSSPIYQKWFPQLYRLASADAEGAAEAIARGVTDRKDQIYYPFSARVQRYFYDIYQEVYEYNFLHVSF